MIRPSTLLLIVLNATAALGAIPAGDLRLLKTYDRGLRATKLFEALERAGEKAGAEWLSAIDAAPSCFARNEDRIVVVEWLAERDPAAAQRYVDARKSNPRHRQELREALVRGWVRYAAAAAWSWAAAQPTVNDVDLLKSTIETLAEVDPDAGFKRLMADVGDPNNASGDSVRTDRFIAFLSRLVDLGDFASCRRYLDEYPAGERKNGALYFEASRMAAYALAETSAWAEHRMTQPDALYPLAAVVLERAKSQQLAAIDWCLGLKNEELRSQLVQYAVADIMDRRREPALVETILAKLKSAHDRQAAYAAFATNDALLRHDAPRFLDWATEIEGRNERRAALVRGYEIWSGFDAERAREHLQKSDRISREDRMAVMSYLAGGAP